MKSGLKKKRRGGVPEFARVPGWVVGEGIYAKLSFKSRILLPVLYLHANRDERKVWCFVKTLSEETGLARRHVGLAKKELYKAGLLLYDFGQKGERHTIWMAGEGAFRFHLKRESADYLRSVQPTTRGLEGCDAVDPGQGPIVHEEVSPSVSNSSSEQPQLEQAEQRN